MHLTQASAQASNISDSGEDPAFLGVLDAAVKFGVLPRTLNAGDTSPFAIVDSPEANDILSMMPATIHEVNDDSIMHNKSGEIECRAST